MKVEKVFINCYRYDFHFAKICIASVRYWYPDVPILLIKDEGQGKFDTSAAERKWNVGVLNIERKKFGWGYGKLEALFLEPQFSFLMLDADTVLTGRILDAVAKDRADFIVDDEVQPAKRFNEIYYNLERINELDDSFVYPGYSFNSGQWLGTSGKITRTDFDETLDWTEPPTCKHPDIVFKGDQAHLNFVVHRLEQKKKISVLRTKIMIWPINGAADFIDLDDIKRKVPKYPYIIHWAGMGGNISRLNRNDILKFYRNYYYGEGGSIESLVDRIRTSYRGFEKKLLHKLNSR